MRAHNWVNNGISGDLESLVLETRHRRRVVRTKAGGNTGDADDVTNITRNREASIWNLEGFR